MSLRQPRLLAAISALGIVVGLLLYGALSPATGSANPIGGFTRVEAGGYATCGITSSGGLKCWGSDDFGGLADGGACGPICLNPVDSTFFTSGIIDVALGEKHTCVLTSGGAVQCVGHNGAGQLGDGGSCGSVCYTTPVNVSGLSSGVIAIAAGYDSSCAVISGGSVQCWGLGYGTPTVISGISNATDVAVTYDHSCALNAAGGVKCWGYNYSGQLGNGTTTDSLGVAVDVSGLTSGVVAVSVGSRFSCAVTTGGGAKCWGSNGSGQLGASTGSCIPMSTFPCSNTPIDVTGLTSGVTGIDAGKATTCVRMSGGGAKCWGNNGEGEIGDGTLTNRPTPIDVTGLGSGVTQVTTAEAAFAAHSCALLSTGYVKCWGANSLGQVGDGQACGFTCTTPSSVATVKPTPTPTPCGSGGCSTPVAQLDFSIGIDTNQDGQDDCSTLAGGPYKCSLPPAALFRVKLYLNGLPPSVSLYDGFDGYLTYTGAAPSPLVDFSPWPDCAFPATFQPPSAIAFSCALGPGPARSAYLGVLASVEFTCAGTRTIDLRHGLGETSLVRYDATLGRPVVYRETPGAPETLNINCNAPPQPTPTPTPPSVGGLSLDSPVAGDGEPSLSLILLISLLAVAGVGAASTVLVVFRD